MFIPSKDKIDKVYASMQVDFKIESDGEINKYLGIELDHHPDGLIHLTQSYTTQRILNVIPGVNKSSSNPTPANNPLQQKTMALKQSKMTLITDQ